MSYIDTNVLVAYYVPDTHTFVRERPRKSAVN